jgi:hypothetical protein
MKPRFPRKLDNAMATTTETSTGKYLPTAKVSPPVGTPIPGAVLAHLYDKHFDFQETLFSSTLLQPSAR